MRLIKKANLRIKGTGNEFVCPKDVHNELLKYGNVRIDGNNNKINIGGPNYLKFTDIKIFGNNNTLILPPGCYGKLNLEIRTSDAVVTVGHKTGFMGTDIILEEKVFFGFKNFFGLRRGEFFHQLAVSVKNGGFSQVPVETFGFGVKIRPLVVFVFGRIVVFAVP